MTATTPAPTESMFMGELNAEAGAVAILFYLDTFPDGSMGLRAEGPGADRIRPEVVATIEESP